MIKYKTFIIKTFDQLKNDNFDQVKFNQVSVSQTTVRISWFFVSQTTGYSRFEKWSSGS